MSHQPRFHAALAHPVLRSWHNPPLPRKADIIYPVFVHEAETETPIPSLPGVSRFSVAGVVAHVAPLVDKGLAAVLVFGVTQHKSEDDGDFKSALQGPVVDAVQALRKAFPGLLIICDVCLCAYTCHGHCGVLAADPAGHSCTLRIDNDATLPLLAAQAVAYALAGADVVAPSDMMDGRVEAIRKALNANGLFHVSVMSYATKYASAMYGPFRDVAGSGVKTGPKDRAGYQLPVGSSDLGLRAALRDVEQGADTIIVKPSVAFLDVASRIVEAANVPVIAYHVSGEFAMLYHAASAGALDLKVALLETLMCMRRAGCRAVITYFAPKLMEWLE